MSVSYPFGSPQEPQSRVLNLKPRKKRGLIGVGDYPSQGGGVVGPYPAPAGTRWAYATTNGVIANSNGSPALTLLQVA